MMVGRRVEGRRPIYYRRCKWVVFMRVKHTEESIDREWGGLVLECRKAFFMCCQPLSRSCDVRVLRVFCLDGSGTAGCRPAKSVSLVAHTICWLSPAVETHPPGRQHRSLRVCFSRCRTRSRSLLYIKFIGAFPGHDAGVLPGE